MSAKSVQDALKSEFTEHVNARVADNQIVRDAAVNKGLPTWGEAAGIPITKTALTEAYLTTPVHPLRALAKIAAIEIASFKRTAGARGMTRLGYYSLGKVRRDVIESAMRSRLSVLTDMAK